MTPRGVAAWALALCLLAVGCRGAPPAERVVIVTLDTTRADHLGCYGYRRGATPHLDALARESAVFDRALTAVPMTLPSHATILTGLYPPQHGVRHNGTYRLEPARTTMAEILKTQGWTTGAVASSFAVAAQFGLDQGFDEYMDLFSGPSAAKLSLDAQRPADDVTRRARDWLARHPSGRAFLWAHYYDPHWPYRPPFPFSDEFRDRPYDGEIAFMDRELGTLLDALRADPSAWNRTLLIIVGDHGEGLYEHGEAMHGTLAYRGTMDVPLIVKPPGRARARRVADVVGTVDLLPTVLDYAGIDRPDGLPGTSLRSAIEGRRLPARGVYFEAVSGALNFGWAALEGIQRDAWKLIAGSDPELYDLATDPAESNSLWSTQADRGKELLQEVDESLAAWRSTGEGPRHELDAEALERLASLGYIGVTGSSTSRVGADPKRLIHIEREVLNVQVAVTQGHWGDVVAGCEYVLGHDPDNLLGLFFIARGYFELGRFEEALPVAEKLAHRYTDFPQGHDLLGIVWRSLKRPDRVVEAYNAGLKFLPESPILRFRLSVALFESGDLAGACLHAREGAARRTSSADWLLLRARCEAGEGKTSAALATLSEVRSRGLDPRPYVEEAPEFRAIRSAPEWLRSLPAGAEEKKTGVVQKED